MYRIQKLVAELRLALTEAAAHITWQLEEIPVADLINSFDIIFDKKNDKKHDYLVKRLQRGSTFPPVLILRQPDGSYLILDGHHRISAFDEVGRETIPCVVGVVGS